MMQNSLESLFNNDITVINVGPKVFGEAVAKQGTEVIQVDWKPIAGGDKEMIKILEVLGGIE